MNDLIEEVKNDPDFARRYELTGRLGEGGMGTVHRGTHRLLGRPVAIKLMRPEFLTEEVPRQRFLSEARTAAGLIHPNVCVVLDFGFAGRVPFLVTELVDGMSLQNIILKSPQGLVEPQLVLSVLRQLLDGLEAIHALGVVHRDLKPANIVVTRDSRAKILDFGLAKPYVDQSSSGGATLPGTVVGTPAYISPEQGTAGKLAPSSDLYALTVILYELVIGQLPFRSESAQEVIKMHVYEEPHLPDNLLTSVRALLKRGLAKRPRERYQNAEEYRKDFEAMEAAVGVTRSFIARTAPLVEPPTDPGDPSLLAGAPVQSPGAPPPSAPPVAAAPVAPPPVAPISRPTAGDKTMQALAVPLKRPWPFLELGVGAVVLIAGLWLTAPRPEPTPGPTASASSGGPPAPRTFYAQYDLMRRDLARGDLSGFNAGIATLRRFRADPPDASESALLDELMLTALEQLCKLDAAPASAPAPVDYLALLADCAQSVKKQRLAALAESVHRAPQLHKGSALDWLRGTALVASAMLPEQLKQGVDLLGDCIEVHPNHFLGAWSSELVTELYAAAKNPGGAARFGPPIHAPSVDDRYPYLVQYRRTISFYLRSAGGQSQVLERALK